jgi:hypothetical protein
MNVWSIGIMIDLTDKQIQHYYHDFRSFAEVVQDAYKDGYEQAIKDMHNFEDGVVVIY